MRSVRGTRLQSACAIAHALQQCTWLKVFGHARPVAPGAPTFTSSEARPARQTCTAVYGNMTQHCRQSTSVRDVRTVWLGCANSMATPGCMLSNTVTCTQIRPYKHQLFSKCDQCVSFTHLRSLISDGNTAALRKLANLKDDHLAYVSRARGRMRERANFARQNPDAVLMINVDGMDQAKTNIPNESVKDKGGSVGMPLCVRLMGAIAYGRGWYGFWSVPQWGATSNLTIMALDYIIGDVLKEGKRRGLKGSHLHPPALSSRWTTR